MLHILSLLDQYPSTRLLIEGYANPVLGTDNEKPTLLTLSGRRAAYIAGILVNSGISPERLVYVGEGGSRPIVPIEDCGNWNQNRRVEIRLIHDIPQAPSASSTETADEHR
ncbi:MAG: OmpA family protein [Spirochaetaceae bacterium]|jgi:outer membrane protein OmpA-like peptidoglycan-associated protein|nr:OmpA family protein [Spirochaetaceae bacterium]